MTSMLVRRHRLAIEHVAETLVVAKSLTGEKIRDWWAAATLLKKSKVKK
jgi:hypothetical protein